MTFISELSDSYNQIHGWLSCTVCVIGLAFNAITITVFTCYRKQAPHSEGLAKTSLILISLAVSHFFDKINRFTCLSDRLSYLYQMSDSVLMLSYIPHSIYSYIIKTESERESPSLNDNFWSVYSTVHMIISVTFHSVFIFHMLYIFFLRIFF